MTKGNPECKILNERPAPSRLAGTVAVAVYRRGVFDLFWGGKQRRERTPIGEPLSLRRLWLSARTRVCGRLGFDGRAGVGGGGKREVEQRTIVVPRYGGEPVTPQVLTERPEPAAPIPSPLESPKPSRGELEDYQPRRRLSRGGYR